MPYKRSPHKFFQLAILILLMTMALTACGKGETAPTPTSTEISSSLTPQPSNTSTFTPEPTLTSTPQANQPTPPIGSIEAPGVLLLSMSDGLFTHIFAYHPTDLPLIRLTGESWNFSDPAVSPDGKSIAYCSDQSGSFEIEILNLDTGLVTPITSSGGYNCSPSWSPDGKWIVYEKFFGTKTDLILRSIEDLSAEPIQLTGGEGNNYNPAWSPTGREIAFVSDRNGRSEIWLARLDIPDDRFSVLGSDPEKDFSTPAWSPDGTMLAWCRSDVEQYIEVYQLDRQEQGPHRLGLGCDPKFDSTGTAVYGIITLPLENDLIGYSIADGRLVIPPIRMNTSINSVDWGTNVSKDALLDFLNEHPVEQPGVIWEKKITAQSETGRTGIVALRDVVAPNAYLSDSVDESYLAMRDALTRKLGWDFLSQLETALLPLTTPPQPGLTQNWLYTGRAIAVSQLPLEAGWMAVTREDHSGLTYWRVWLKCRKQDGTCGRPVLAHAWDFNARYSGNQVEYQQGGKVGGPLEGYWLDFTEFASRFGWQRLPAYNNWRSYFPASQLNIFVLRENTDWQQALLELYPPEAVQRLLESQ